MYIKFTNIYIYIFSPQRSPQGPPCGPDPHMCLFPQAQVSTTASHRCKGLETVLGPRLTPKARILPPAGSPCSGQARLISPIRRALFKQNKAWQECKSNGDAQEKVWQAPKEKSRALGGFTLGIKEAFQEEGCFLSLLKHASQPCGWHSSSEWGQSSLLRTCNPLTSTASSQSRSPDWSHTASSGWVSPTMGMGRRAEERSKRGEKRKLPLVCVTKYSASQTTQRRA